MERVVGKKGVEFRCGNCDKKMHFIGTAGRDGQNHHILMILKSNHLNKGDLKSKSKSF